MVAAMAFAAPHAFAAEGAWFGPKSRLVALNAEQQRTGLDGADFFFGLAGGVRGVRWSADLDILQGTAHQRLRIDGVDDPQLRIWAVDGGVRVRPYSRWPLVAGARAGFWHFDYRNESVILDFPGSGPIEVAFDDFTEPAVTATGGLDLAPLPWLALTVEAGLIGLRLNEARIDGQTVSVTQHWRASPTAAIGLGFRAAGNPSLVVGEVRR
jgi:hypothetical protein